MDNNRVLTNALFRKKIAELLGEDIVNTPQFNDFNALDAATFTREMDKVIDNPPWSGGGSGGGEAYEVHIEEASGSICYLHVDPTDYTQDGEPIYTNAVIKDSDDNTLTAYDVYHIYKETTENIVVISSVSPPDGPEMHIYYPLIQEMSMNVPGFSSVYRYFIFGFTINEPGGSGYVGQEIIVQSNFDGQTGDEIAASVTVTTNDISKALIGETAASVNIGSGQFVVAPVTSEDPSTSFTLQNIERAYTAGRDVYVKVQLTDDGDGGTAGQVVNRKIKFNLKMVDNINATALFEASVLESGGVTHLQLEGIDNGGSLVWSITQKSLS